MPRFVILRHELPADHMRPTHWDLMLECGSVLRTWALESLLSPHSEVVAEKLPDHRLAYLEYEGPVSAGRGWVSRVDAGEYQLESDDPDELIVSLVGECFVGRLHLRSKDNGSPWWGVQFSADSETAAS